MAGIHNLETEIVDIHTSKFCTSKDDAIGTAMPGSVNDDVADAVGIGLSAQFDLLYESFDCQLPLDIQVNLIDASCIEKRPICFTEPSHTPAQNRSRLNFRSPATIALTVSPIIFSTGTLTWGVI